MFDDLGSQLTFVHCLVIVLSIPLILKKVKRNRLYGFRLKKTLSSDEIWYPANVIAGWSLCLCSLIGLGLVQAATRGVLELSDGMLVGASVGLIVVACIYPVVRLKSM